MGCKFNHVTDNDIDEDLRIGCAQNALALCQLNLAHEISLAI